MEFSQTVGTPGRAGTPRKCSSSPDELLRRNRLTAGETIMRSDGARTRSGRCKTKSPIIVLGSMVHDISAAAGAGPAAGSLRRRRSRSSRTARPPSHCTHQQSGHIWGIRSPVSVANKGTRGSRHELTRMIDHAGAGLYELELTGSGRQDRKMPIWVKGNYVAPVPCRVRWMTSARWGK